MKICWDFSIGGGEMGTEEEGVRQRAAESNIESLKNAIWSLTGIIPQLLQTTEWWRWEVEEKSYGHQIVDMKNYGRVNRENRYKMEKESYPTAPQFDEWTHGFVKEILNGRIEAGGTIETPEGKEWRQFPLIDILSKYTEEITMGVPKTPSSLSTITLQESFDNLGMFQKNAVFQINSKRVNRDYDMPFRLRNDFDKEGKRPEGWRFEEGLGTDVKFNKYWQNPYIFYGETDTGGYLWTVKVEFKAMVIGEDMQYDKMKEDDIRWKNCFLIFQFSDSDFYRPWFYTRSGSFDFGLERVIIGADYQGMSNTEEDKALGLVYENIMYSEHGGSKVKEPEDIYRTAFLGEKFRSYGHGSWLNSWSAFFPRPEYPKFGLMNWWW